MKRIIITIIITLSLFPQFVLASEDLNFYLSKFIGNHWHNCGTEYKDVLGSTELEVKNLLKSIDCIKDNASNNIPSLTFHERSYKDSNGRIGYINDKNGVIYHFSYDGSPCGGPSCESSFTITKCPDPVVAPIGSKNNNGPGYRCKPSMALH